MEHSGRVIIKEEQMKMCGNLFIIIFIRIYSRMNPDLHRKGP
jgi:hypothetical protein